MGSLCCTACWACSCGPRGCRCCRSRCARAAAQLSASLVGHAAVPATCRCLLLCHLRPCRALRGSGTARSCPMATHSHAWIRRRCAGSHCRTMRRTSTAALCWQLSSRAAGPLPCCLRQVLLLPVSTAPWVSLLHAARPPFLKRLINPRVCQPPFAVPEEWAAGAAAACGAAEGCGPSAWH